MELRTQEFQAPQAPEFNYDELKAWITERAEEYKTIVYTDADIGQAKEDRAALNRLKKALNDRRISVEKEFMAPFLDFKAKINELIALIDEPAKLIDQRVKEYEQAKKDEKAAQIGELFDSIEDKPEWLQVGMIWNSKWLNATCSMKKIREELDAILETIRKDLATLSEIKDFGFEATEEYKRSLDINKALAEGMRLAEIQKRKEAEEKARAEAEARRAEAERQARLQAQAEPEWQMPDSAYMNAPDVVEITEPFPGGPVEQMELPQWVRFEACMTTQQSFALKDFFIAHGIKFRPI